MRSTILIILSALLFLAGSAAADYVKLQPDPSTGKDAFINIGDPDGNYGDNVNLCVASPANSAGCTFIALDNYFGNTCDDAYLWFYVETPADQDDTGLLMGAVDGDWQETTIIWNNMPGVHDSESISYPTQGYNWWGINVQPIVEDWLNGTYDNDGFCFFDNSGPGTEGAQVYSSDLSNDPDLRPCLKLYYSPGTEVEESSWGSIKTSETH
ncbi:MAG: DNRLRE domain-containing protein [Candidatus Coatesbacteria bacterium]|nr:DNRLRE domain-containing protein [Candidatus Coatesbacteria bacterium]